MKNITQDEMMGKGNQIVIGLHTNPYTMNIGGVWFNVISKPYWPARAMMSLLMGIKWYNNIQDEKTKPKQEK